MKNFNEQGAVSIIAALLALVSLLAMGSVIVFLSASNQTSRANYLSSNYALYVTQAGIEYAVKKVWDGESEIVNPPGLAFGKGTFTVSRSGRTLTVTGTVGNAVRQYKVDSPTEADCTDIDISNVEANDENVTHLYFNKICLQQITIDKVQLTWVPNNNQKLLEFKIESNKIYDDPVGVSSGTLIDTADYTVNNTNNNTINWIKFDNNIENTSFTMTWTMGDESTKTITFDVED